MSRRKGPRETAKGGPAKTVGNRNRIPANTEGKPKVKSVPKGTRTVLGRRARPGWPRISTATADAPLPWW